MALRPPKRQTFEASLLPTKKTRVDVEMGEYDEEEEQWECAKCGNMNYGSRLMCNMRNCCAPRSEEPWNCPSCGNENYATRLFCNMKKCQLARPGLTAAALLLAERQTDGIPALRQSASVAAGVPLLSSAPATGGGHGQTPPAWTCTKCGNSNFAGRTHCNSRKCGAPYSLAGPKAPRNGNNVFGQSPPAWTCNGCGNENRAGRQVCNMRNCGAPYPGVVAVNQGFANAVRIGAAANLSARSWGTAGAAQARPPEGPEPTVASSRCASRCGGRHGHTACSNVNYPTRATCNARACGLPREEVDGGYPGSGHAPSAPPGSWTCKLCSNVNWPTRMVCNAHGCRAPKN